MYRKIRITVVSLVVATMCVLSSTGTLSYFTDTDSATNDFTVGNAKSELKIYEDENGTPFGTSVLDPLTDNMSNIPYYLQAENLGNIPVYQRFRVVIPSALANVITLEIPNCTLAADANNANKSTCSNDDYTITYDTAVESEDTTYAVYYIISNAILELNGVKSKTASWPTSAIRVGAISGIANLEEVAVCPPNDSNNCKFGVRAYSDVVQTTGFTSAVQAFVNFTETYN